jgi:hypothetical protein
VDLSNEAPDPFMTFVDGRVQHPVRHVKAKPGIAFLRERLDIAAVQCIVRALD